MIRMLADLIRVCLRHWLALVLVTSAALLAIVHATETFGGLAPCLLCLKQREVYWAAMTVSAVGLGLHFTPLGRRFDRLFGAALAIVFAYGVFLAVRHAGAEWKWWPGPAACAANKNATVTAADMQALLSGAKIKMPSCEDAAWRDPIIHLSLAGWNAIISLKLLVYSLLLAAGWEPKRG